MKISDKTACAIITFGCLDEGVDEDDDGLVGDPESFLTFFSFNGGESGPFSTLGELASYKTTKELFSIHNQFYIYRWLLPFSIISKRPYCSKLYKANPKL